MKLQRREFVELMGLSAASMAMPFSGPTELSAENVEVVERNGWQLKVTSTGDIVSLRDGKMELLNRQLGENHPRLLFVGKKLFICNQPTVSHRDGLRLLFQYAFSGATEFTVDYEIELVSLGENRLAVKQRISMDFPTRVRETIKLWLPRNIQLPFENRKVFVPLKSGIGRQKPVLGLDNDDEYVFRLSGGYEVCRPQMLAVPMIDEYADQTDLHLTCCADPFFTSYFFLPHGQKMGQFHCIYPESVPLKGREERSIYTVLHRGDAKTAMQVFYDYALPETKPGPEWMHEVAMVDFDYLSENGQGWFADIDKLKEVIPPADRSKVFLALHGWYDVVGRYSFDYRARSLDKKWIAFPSCRDSDFQSYGDAPETGDPYRFHKKSIENMHPVEMSVADMHRRLRYAKDHGFRVGLYFSDGLLSGTEVKDLYDPTKVLNWGGWKGPDTKGRVYVQNPLHPEVRDFYRNYVKALLVEYGTELDGFIWDETHYIGPGTLGNEAFPGFADRGMMTLIKEVAAIVASFNPQLAQFTSDNIGLWNYTDKIPYTLVAHGTYQDSACRPEAWSWGLFPNHRNVLWSCNWAPISHFHFTRYAVETFSIPVAISNGSFGDDIGISEMDAQHLKQILDLFERRKQKKNKLGWVEENLCEPTYEGKPLKYRWSL